MTVPPEAWSIDATAVEPLSPDVERLCPFHLETRGAAVDQRLFGAWWLRHFGRGWGGDLVGLRLLPGVPLSQCPVVRAMGPGAVTIASRPAHLVPVVVLEKMLESANDWRFACELLDGEWEELMVLHAALGGGDRLTALRSVIFDDELRTACAHPGSAAWNGAATEAFSRLDATLETTREKKTYM